MSILKAGVSLVGDLSSHAAYPGLVSSPTEEVGPQASVQQRKALGVSTPTAQRSESERNTGTYR